jgi:hypothetical protein
VVGVSGAAIAAPSPAGAWVQRRMRALRVAATIAVLGIGPFILGVVMLWLEARRHMVAVDFRDAYLPAAHDLLHGRSPYPGMDDPRVAAGSAFVYPIPALLTTLPFVLVPAAAAVWLVTGVLIALVPLTLWVLEVRDWRCYGAALVWAPVAASVQTGNLSIPIAFGLALAWRFRDQLGFLAVFVTTVMKLLTWPLALWLFVTRRRGRAILAIAAAAGVVGLSCVVLSSGFRGYLSLTRHVDSIEARDSLTVFALCLQLGVPSVIAKLAWLSVGLGVLVASVVSARRGHERESFVLAVGATLLLVPIVWLHYFALLLVPVGISRPRFSAAWIAPVLLWTVRAEGGERPAWQTALTLAVFASSMTLCLVREREPLDVREPRLASTV